MKCEYCEIVAENRDILYQDEQVVVAVKDIGLIPGQITVFPKQHFTIMEMVPKEMLQKCVAIANKAGIAVFEGLGCQGTNVLVQNGLGAGQKVPHFAMEIIPRNEQDGLQLQWQPQPLAEDELEITALTLKEELEKPEKAQPAEEKPAEKISEKESKKNYLLKVLKRMP